MFSDAAIPQRLSFGQASPLSAAARNEVAGACSPRGEPGSALAVKDCVYSTKHASHFWEIMVLCWCAMLHAGS